MESRTENRRLPAGRFRAAALAAAFALAGCAAPDRSPTPDQVAAIPSRWHTGPTGARDPAALVQWWRQFNDPVLDRLIDEALRSNTDVRTACSRIDQFRATRGTVKAALAPSLSAAASGQQGAVHLRHSPVTERTDSYGAEGEASWQTDLFGVQRQNLAAASGDLAQAQDLYRAAEITIEGEVATAYVTLRGAEGQLAVVRSSVATEERTLDLTRWQQRTGAATELDADQAESVLEQERSEIPGLERTISQARNQIALLLGRPPGSEDALLSSAMAAPSAPDGIGAGIPAETLAQRPDVLAARDAVEAAEARVRSARRQRLPTLSLTGTIGPESFAASRLLSPQAIAESAVESLAAPIFDAGLIAQTIAVQDSVEKQALIAYEAAVLTALSDVDNALTAVRRLHEELAILEKAAAAAERAAALSQQEYQAGQVDLLVVLDAQRTYLAIEQTRVGAQADGANAAIQLCQALGGGWSPRGTGQPLQP
jgi:NodT family efflux transporter outer membrane factor (OMF) lipoprotein